MKFKIKNNLFYFCLFLKVIFFNNCMLLRKVNDTILEMESAGVENKEINYKNQNQLKTQILMKYNKSTTFKYEYSDLYFKKGRVNIDDKIPENGMILKITKIINLYMQFFVILTIISFHKWYEEIIRVKRSYIENKYSSIKDLTSPENKLKDISNFDGDYVFTSGTTTLISPAEDPVFKFIDQNYAIIERKVEYFDIINKRWMRLGYINNRLDTSVETESRLNTLNNLTEINLVNDSIIELSFNGEIFSFPRLISSISLGSVELNGIKMNHQHLKKLNKYKKIKIPLELKYEATPKGYQKIQYRIEENYFIIYPCDSEKLNTSSSDCKMRISFRGYKCKKASVIAKLKNNSFRSFHIPYEQKEDSESEYTGYINQSANMGKIINYNSEVSPNFNFDFFNIFCCFCFSGPASYSEKGESQIGNKMTINLLVEKEISKESMINERHGISWISSLLTRMMVFILLFIGFYFLPEPLITIFKLFNLTREDIIKKFVTMDLIACKVLITFVIVFSKISYKLKHIIYMLLVSLILLSILTISFFEIARNV